MSSGNCDAGSSLCWHCRQWYGPGRCGCPGSEAELAAKGTPITIRPTETVLEDLREQVKRAENVIEAAREAVAFSDKHFRHITMSKLEKALALYTSNAK